MSDKAMQQVPEDAPLMIAWKAHQKTDEYRNSKKWASAPEHLEGSLWALFAAGFEAALSVAPAPVAANPVSFTRYYMRDNHTFKTLSLDNSAAVDEIRAEFDDGYTYGMVCGKYSDNKARGEGSEHANGDWHEFSFRAAKWLNDHPAISPPVQEGPKGR